MSRGSDERVRARRALLEHACRSVTVADIEACATCIDPGYPAYVARLTEVLQSKGRDGIDQVDWEVIFHAANDEPRSTKDPQRSRRYRVFTAAIGTLHPSLGELIAPSSLAISLVEDATTLADPSLSANAYAALDELRAVSSADGDGDASFLLLACLLVASAARMSDVDLSALAVRVFDEEAKHHGRAAKPRSEPMFLWSCSRFINANAIARWKRSIERYVPSSTQSLASLRTVLLRTLIAV